MSWYNFGSFLSPAEKKAKAQKKLKALQAEGRVIEPLGQLSHRIKIATSFWGRAWCRHLESFSDYENRLPRGRTYVRNGSVLHLGIEQGSVSALVHGSELYELTIRIDPIDAKKWQATQARCRGKIGSLIELLQGTISDEIMAIVTDQNDGLFPHPREIHLNCNCPDWATMCKHVAAVLYGIGARLDTKPELLFRLRGVDHNELIAIDNATALDAPSRPSSRRTLAASSLGSVFGIDLEISPAATVMETPADFPVPAEPEKKTPPAPKKSAAAGKKSSGSHKAATAKKTAPPTATGKTLGSLRSQLALGRTTFARKLGVSVATLTQWERTAGTLTMPKSVQAKLARLQGG